jgi:AraC-like DNA-binding protein
MDRRKREPEAILAARAGRYEEFAPSPVLCSHFHCLWSHELDNRLSRRVAIVPDGYCDIVWMDGRLLVAGPDRISAFPPVEGSARIVGARFAPGAAADWLGLPLSEIVGCSIDLAALWGRKALALEARLADCTSTQDRLGILTQSLEKQAVRREPPSKAMGYVFAKSDKYAAAGNISDLISDLGLSERQFRRRCHHHFGYGARTLARIRRFQALLRLFAQEPLQSLAMLAVAAGYADQAHMTRDTGEISTLTPLQLRRQIAG